jgi:parvulin-like peptidyl-prolyl isomerase
MHPSGPVAERRLGLLVFGSAFVALLIGFAIVQGIGEPSVPSGDIALVQDVPEDIGSISEADLDRAFLQRSAALGLKKPPKPDEKRYEQVREEAMGEILNQAWIRGEAEELGLSATPREVASELAQQKQNFKNDAEFQEFLKTAHLTSKEVNGLMELQLLGNQIQDRLNTQAPSVSDAEVEAYYDSVKSTEYATPESREVRLITNKNKAKVEAAKVLLEKDNSPENWKKVAAKFSEDLTTKSYGGLQRSLTKELLSGAPGLKELVFSTPANGVIAGPIDLEDKSFEGEFLALEVVKVIPPAIQALREVKGNIESALNQQKQQEAFNDYIGEYRTKWTSRTFCAEGFVVERCSNFKGSGHPQGAPPACYEADPKTPPKDCPAPVVQAKPAMPGTVTILKPTGEQLAQRPIPEPPPPGLHKVIPSEAP